MLGVVAGPDARDPTVSPRPVGSYEAACDRDVRGLRIGVLSDLGPGLDPEVAASVQAAIARLESQGCEARPIEMPFARYGVSTYYVLATAEASSNLARYDGVRFGARVEPPGATLDRMYSATRGAGFGREVKRRILLGTYVLSAGYYDAYYKKAQQVRTLIRRDFDRVFAEVDAIVTPTSPTPAFELGERIDDPLSMYLADVYTLPASLAGVCAVSVPIAPTTATPSRLELPVGLQLDRARIRGGAALHAGSCDRGSVALARTDRPVKVVSTSAEHAEGLAGLFERSGSPCFCRYWHFTGDKNQWLDRSANRAEENRAEMFDALRQGSDEMRGLVALEGDTVVGFMKLAPAASLTKLYATRLYKGLPVLDRDPEGVLSVGCFLVDERFRHRGVARALLDGGIRLAKSTGASCIEAFPRNAEGVGDEELWTGPLSLFESAGFETITIFALIRCCD